MTRTDISRTIANFIKQVIHMDLVDSMDEIYLRNRLLDYLHLDAYEEPDHLGGPPNLLDSLDQLVEYAVQHHVIEDFQSTREIFEAKIMDLVTPIPSAVNNIFWNKYEKDKKQATDYFYTLSQQTNYIQTRQIAKNLLFKTNSPYGRLEVTINLSKPEKDPKEIAAQKKNVSTHYPKCALCLENEGYKGGVDQAARTNHRVIRMDLQEETYGMQYSPYVYYNEHSIFLNEVHKPMVIDRNTIENLLEIIDFFPHYFVGSNADLPIVGGSILNHDHYQGGRYDFPIEGARILENIQLNNFPTVKISILHWPLSVLRLQSHNKRDMVEAVTHIMKTWENYSNEEQGIISHTGNTRHNTITPIARFTNDLYEMDIVLRNNRTSKEYPDGVFHPHPDVHHIKKENIGLIEVMGLAILPPRLAEELKQIEDFLLDKKPLEGVKPFHRDWALKMRKENSYDKESIEIYIKQKIGGKFTRVLEDAGVFKQTENGIRGFKRFVEKLNEVN